MRNWLKEKRIIKRLSMKAIADSAKISECYYSQIENGTRNPSVKVAQKIAKVLNFSWLKFFE